ncbi:NF041680 family putative transposase [Kitasatospora indigofera]
MSIVVPEAVRRQAVAELSSFRMDLYAAMPRRADALFEVSDALLCADGPVRALVELALAPEHRRSHGSLYAALNRGDLDAGRLRCAIAARSLPRGPGGRIVLAVDVSAWLRPDANTSDARSFCHTYGRRENTHEMVPGWPYSFVAALESGSTSWTALLDARRLEPGADTAAVTAAQLREVLRGIFNAGHWKLGDPPVVVVADAGYDGPRLAYLLRDLPVQIVVRVRSDRVFFNPVPDDYRVGPKGGQPRCHGTRFALADPETWRDPDSDSEHTTRRYGTARVRAWHRLHPRIWRRSAWSDHQGQLPVIEGTLIRLDVDHLPSGGTPKPVWLWFSDPTPSSEDTDTAWHAFLRRFDLEHTFRFLKQTLGWTRPRLREPAAADRWTYLVLAAHTQLRLARPLAADLRRPWERPQPAERLTPARVRRGFRNIRTRLACPTSVARPSRPGPGRPPGRPNLRRAPSYDVGLALVTDH